MGKRRIAPEREERGAYSGDGDDDDDANQNDLNKGKGREYNGEARNEGKA